MTLLVIHIWTFSHHHIFTDEQSASTSGKCFCDHQQVPRGTLETGLSVLMTPISVFYGQLRFEQNVMFTISPAQQNTTQVNERLTAVQ